MAWFPAILHPKPHWPRCILCDVVQVFQIQQLFPRFQLSRQGAKFQARICSFHCHLMRTLTYSLLSLVFLFYFWHLELSIPCFHSWLGLYNLFICPFTYLKVTYLHLEKTRQDFQNQGSLLFCSLEVSQNILIYFSFP